MSNTILVCKNIVNTNKIDSGVNTNKIDSGFEAFLTKEAHGDLALGFKKKPKRMLKDP